MNKNKNKKKYKLSKQFNFREYIVTVIVSLCIVIIVSFAIELELMYRCEESISLNEMRIENLNKFATIEQLEKEYLKNPEDFSINIKLAKMYEGLGEIDKANEFYQNALSVSKRSNYAIYSYAMFCSKNNLYATAAALVDEIDGNTKKANNYKARIYESIADLFAKKGDYSAALKSYQIVYKYAKSLGNIKYVNSIRDKYAKTYINLADANIKAKEIDEAIANLKNSIELKDSAVAQYKLGLIYEESDPVKAEKYINNALSRNPFVVNPYIYNSILKNLIDETRILGQDSRHTYYTNRLNRFKKQIEEIYLYKNEVTINNPLIVEKKNIFNQVKNILTFEVENMTNTDIENLFVMVELVVNGQKHVFEKKIFNSSKPLYGLDKVLCDEFIIPKEIKFNDLKENNDIFAKFYAKKTAKAPWVLLKIEFLNI